VQRTTGIALDNGGVAPVVLERKRLVKHQHHRPGVHVQKVPVRVGRPNLEGYIDAVIRNQPKRSRRGYRPFGRSSRCRGKKSIPTNVLYSRRFAESVLYPWRFSETTGRGQKQTNNDCGAVRQCWRNWVSWLGMGKEKRTDDESPVWLCPLLSCVCF
jgi:hypothetical protein